MPLPFFTYNRSPCGRIINPPLTHREKDGTPSAIQRITHYWVAYHRSTGSRIAVIIPLRENQKRCVGEEEDKRTRGREESGEEEEEERRVEGRKRKRGEKKREEGKWKKGEQEKILEVVNAPRSVAPSIVLFVSQ